MAGANAIHSTTTTKHQKLAAEKNQEKDTSKFHYHFLYKAALVAIFFVILPLFPSQAPEFINRSLVTRNWELLHILFVGIAISYGLFSRRHDETDKENNGPKFDNTQSLVARFLQVPSFFEDEAELTPSCDEFSDETKVQTWSNQHYRNEPVVVVAPPQAQQKTNNFENKVSSASGGSSSSRIIGEKPLLLPVRSLKSRSCDDPSDDDDVVVVQPFNRSNSYKTGSKRFSSNSSIKARNAELEGPGPGVSSGSTVILEKKKDNVVLPSPIPWRSRSGKFEPKQEAETLITTTQYASNSKPSMEESEFNKVDSRSLKSQTSRNSSRTSPILSPSPKLAPSPSSSESLAKSKEDVTRKKGFYKSCPPPPPPLPPMFQKSISMKPRRYGSFIEGGNNNSFDKELKRSLTSEGNISRGKKVGDGGIMNGSQLEDEEEHFMEEPITRKSTSTGKGYENMSFRTDKFKGHANVALVSEPPAPMEFVEEEEKESFLDGVVVETDYDEDTETEDEDVEGIRNMKKECEKTSPPAAEGSKTNDETSSGSFGDEGPDVDKKADEFIAKFREQIRLQRIESIKKSTRSTRNSST